MIAYRQPATRAEVEAIRGVNCDQTFYTLASRRLIEERGRKEAPVAPFCTGRHGSSSNASACKASTTCRALSQEGALVLDGAEATESKPG